jgi:hypothetical protein
MKYILKLIAAIVVITYALRLVNAESDLLVLGGVGIIGSVLYFAFTEFNKVLNHLNSKL